MGGVATPLIERNTTIPVKKSQIFTTAENNQTAVDIHVVQGERPLAADNKTLGNFRLDGIPAAMRGVPQIEVTFDIDANGIVNVTAKDLGSGKEQKITITASSNMSKDEIDNAVKEAQKYAEEDKKHKEAIDVVNQADSMVFQAESTLNQLGDKVDATDKSAIQAAADKLKNLAEAARKTTPTDAQIAEIKEATDALTKTLNDMAQKLYQQQGQQGGAGGQGFNGGQGFDGGQNFGGAGGFGGGAGNGGKGPDDDVVDADYKEV